jgi:hypothetical protein
LRLERVNHLVAHTLPLKDSQPLHLHLCGLSRNSATTGAAGRDGDLWSEPRKEGNEAVTGPLD